MMNVMYDDNGLEPEADYDEEYTVSTNAGDSIPIYYPRSQNSSSNDNRYVQLNSGPVYSQVVGINQIPEQHQGSSHIYHQSRPEPQIQQVFEEYAPTGINGSHYVPATNAVRVPVIKQVASDSDHIQRVGQPEQRPPPTVPVRTRVERAQLMPTAIPSTSTSSLSSLTSSDTMSTTTLANSSKNPPLLVSGVIPTLQPPTTRIPKKKRLDTDQSNLITMESNAPIGTEEGWKNLNTAMKLADRDKNTARLIQLLRQCIQNEVSMTLLTSNDTPKIVRRMSKTHENPEVRQLSAQCVSKWKKAIVDPANPDTEKKVKKTVDDNSSLEGKSKKSEKRRLSNENEKIKPKKVVASTSKDEEDSPENKKKKMEEAKKDIKKLSPIPKKVQASSFSSGFMTALTTTEPPKKKLQQKKKSEVKSVPSDPLSVLDILDENKTKPEAMVPGIRRKTPTPPPEEIPVKANRKIKFADECGKEIVEIRFFEVEEVNVNRLTPEEMKHHEAMMERRFKQESLKFDDEDEKEVAWRLLAIDDELLSQHYHKRGSQSEAKIIEEKRQMCSLRAFCDPTQPFNIVDDPEDWDPKAVLPEPPSIPVYTERELQLQKVQALAAALPSQAGASPASTPSIPTTKPEEKKPQLPNNLQNLLDGLKKQGIVGGGPGQPTSLATLIPGLSSILASTTATSSVSNFPQPQVTQPQYQQITQPQAFVQFPPTQYQQQFPTQQPVQTNLPSMPSNNLPQRAMIPGPSSVPKLPRLCHQFRNGHCHFGDRCRFLHDQNDRSISYRGGRGETFRGRGRPYERRDYRDRERDRDRRDYHDQRDDRDPRDFQTADRTGIETALSPQSAQSPSIRSPSEFSSPGVNKEIVTIPAERVE